MLACFQTRPHFSPPAPSNGKEHASVDSDDAALRPPSHLLPSSSPLSVLSSTEGPSSSAAPSTEALAPLATHEAVLSSSSSSASSISSPTEDASECDILQVSTRVAIYFVILCYLCVYGYVSYSRVAMWLKIAKKC